MPLVTTILDGNNCRYQETGTFLLSVLIRGKTQYPKTRKPGFFWANSLYKIKEVGLFINFLYTFKKRGNYLLETLVRTIDEIKIARKQFEERFIRIIAG